MKLKKLTLSNFRAFKNFECDFQEGINVLVGLNGQGKTSVLDAIALAYAQFIGGFGTASGKNISDTDIHLVKHLIGDTDDDGYHMEHQLPVIVHIDTFSQDEKIFPTSWTRVRKTLKGGTSNPTAPKKCAEIMQEHVRSGEKISLPLFSYYGTGRLWPSNKLNVNQSKSGPSRLDVYTDCLDPSSKYDKFSSWLRSETIANHERTMRIVEESGLDGLYEMMGATVRGRLLGAVKNAVNCCLESAGWTNVRYSAGSEDIIATHEFQGDVPVSNLSDGVRNMIGMIADIAYRAVKLNPHLDSEAVLSTEGIVLIDEVDMHLHPEWQQLVLQNLSEAFPNIQFIVTTHSPQVLSTVRKDQIIMLTSDGADSPLGNTYGEPSNYLLTQVFGVDSRPPLAHSELLKEYLTLIESGLSKSKDAVKLRLRLEEMMGSDHSDLKAADRAIQRKDLLG